MGGVLAFALTMFLQNKGIKLPDVVFMSGASVEQKKRKKKITDMDDTELANYLCIHSGTDQKILCSKWYRKYYFPIIRRDYQILELYRPIEKKINCPIYAFAGEEDSEVPLDLVVKMKKYTENFHIQLFEGNHFFINSAVEEIISQICKVIVRNDS